MTLARSPGISLDREHLLTSNLQWLSRTLELTQVEADIVQFLALI
jgi:hypothetical protein